MRSSASDSRRTAMDRRHKVTAFTLVELLVVIGIITVLIGILLPSVTRARLAAKKTQTLSNLRQIGIAVIDYEQEWHGFPPTDLPDVNQDGRAFSGLALLAGMYKLPTSVLINPHTNDTPATTTDPATGWPVLLELDGVPITLTSPATIDTSNVGRVVWHCSFAYDHEKKRSGRAFQSRVYLGDRADYGRGRSYSGNWDGKGMCLLWTDGHGEFVTSKAIGEQFDPNIYHHNQYYDDNGNYPGEGATDSVDGISVIPDTLDTHLRVFSEDEDDALLPNP